MAYWLIKSEPDVYGWDTFVKDKTTMWDGVRNYQARNNMQAMQKGDVCLFYHTGDERRIMGTCTVVKTAYQDPTTDEPAWVVVDVKVGKPFKHPVTLDQMKKTTGLEGMALIKQGRLSVVPVTEEEYSIIASLGHPPKA